jgi:hypothetical protein
MTEQTWDTVPNWYIPQNVAEIEDFEPDQYGNIWYNVKFQGDADTHMWLAKNKPEENKKYYGHFEKTKSGKRLRFKTDKVPEEEFKAQPETAERQESINRAVALNNAVNLFTGQKDVPEGKIVLKTADKFLEWLKNEEAEEQSDPQWTNLTPPEDLEYGTDKYHD